MPQREAQRQQILARLQEVFRLAGYAPIDTPVLEYAEVLLGKGGGETDKQVYRFTDHGGREVALRYDLTVPFARFMAAHLGELPLPFRRWHAAKAWRGENTQRGRYREFMQVDFDVVGTDSASADLEILLLMRQSLASLGMQRSVVHFSHRGVFNEFLSRRGMSAAAVDVLRIIDKERKIGTEKTRELLTEIAGAEAARDVLEFTRVEATPRDTLAKIRMAVGAEHSGAARISAILTSLDQLQAAASFVLDPSITRGLDYYTGVVFETFLVDLPDIGSICSGGRYNDLASLYCSQKLPGVGASIGVDRLMAAMEELGLLKEDLSAAALLVLCLDETLLADYHRFAAGFREAGLAAEVYPEARKLAVQFGYAEKRGIPLALVWGDEERKSGSAGLKDLRTRESYEGLTLEAAIGKAKELLR